MVDGAAHASNLSHPDQVNGPSARLPSQARLSGDVHVEYSAPGETRSGNPPMIEAKNLSKRFGPVLAVDDLSFTVKPGLVTGFLGPNGAGKTTTMKLILGLDSPTAGLRLRRRPALRRPAGAATRGGRAPRRQGHARRPSGLRPSRCPGPEQRHPASSGSMRYSASSVWSRWPSAGPAGSPSG